MQTTATIVASLGTDPANVRHAIADRRDTTNVSFATSFGENSVLTVEVPSPAPDKKLKATVEFESSVPENDQGTTAGAAAMKINQDANVGEDMRKEPTCVKDQTQLASKKMSSLITSAVTLPATGLQWQHGYKMKEDIVLTGLKMPDDQLSSADVQNTDQKNVSIPSDGIKSEVLDRTIGTQIDEAASVALHITKKIAKSVADDAKESLVVMQKPQAVPVEKGAKSHDGAVNIAKGEEKKTVETVENATGTQGQILIAVPVTALSADRQQHCMNAVPENGVLSSATAPTSDRHLGMTDVKNNKRGQNSADIKKASDGTAGVATPSESDDLASRKTGADVPKTALSIKTTDTDSEKAQATATVAMISGAAHAELRVADVGFLGSSGGAAAHILPSATIQSHVINPPATTPQANSMTIEAGPGVDATPKILRGTPKSLEVGVPDGTHGWLKIRAEMADSGAINTSLSASSPSGQEMLHREVPSLTAYLQSEHVVVNAIVVQPSLAGGTDPRNFSGGVSGNAQGQAQQSGNQSDGHREDTTKISLDYAKRDELYNLHGGIRADELSNMASSMSGGNWLSVRA